MNEATAKGNMFKVSDKKSLESEAIVADFVRKGGSVQIIATRKPGYGARTWKKR